MGHVYLVQKEDYYEKECASFALYNCLMYYGIEPDLETLIKYCKASEIDGTNYENFNSAIEYINQTYSTIRINLIEPTINNINKYLSKGIPLIIVYHWEEYWRNGGHFGLIVPSNEKSIYKIINYTYDEPIGKIKLRKLKTLLIPHGPVPLLWTCEKLGNQI